MIFFWSILSEPNNDSSVLRHKAWDGWSWTRTAAWLIMDKPRVREGRLSTYLSSEGCFSCRWSWRLLRFFVEPLFSVWKVFSVYSLLSQHRLCLQLCLRSLAHRLHSPFSTGSLRVLRLHVLTNTDTVWQTDLCNTDRVCECAWEITSLKRNFVLDRNSVAVSMCLLTALGLHYDSQVKRASHDICLCVKAYLTPSSCQSVARHETNTPYDISVHQSEAQWGLWCKTVLSC